MPGPENAAELDKFIDTSMEGTEDDFIGDDDELEEGDEQEQEQDSDTSPEQPELPLEQPKTAKQPDQPQQPVDPANPNGYARVGHLFADKAGNIVNFQGRIIAAKGEAARHWVNMSKQAGLVPQLQQQLRVVAEQAQRQDSLLQQAREIAETPQRMGMSRDEYNDAINLLSNFNRDPVGVAREMVSRALAKGHNVTDIMGTQAGDALEMGAVRRLIDEATRGQRQQEARMAAQTQQQENARQQYNNFVMRYPDAELHGDAIANLMNNHQLSAVEAYHEVKHFAQRYGLDFSQPLAPQIEAAQQRAQQPNGNGQRSPQTQRAPMVSGASGGRSTMTTETEYADPNSDWSSILNSVMRNS
jgi:hypothetical protein